MLLLLLVPSIVLHCAPLFYYVAVAVVWLHPSSNHSLCRSIDNNISVSSHDRIINIINCRRHPQPLPLLLAATGTSFFAVVSLFLLHHLCVASLLFLHHNHHLCHHHGRCCRCCYYLLYLYYSRCWCHHCLFLLLCIVMYQKDVSCAPARHLTHVV